MERFSKPEGQNEILYGELRQRLEYGERGIEWWQTVFQDLRDAKQYLFDQNLIAEIDALISEYDDLTQYIRKDEKSMEKALTATNAIIESVMEAIRP